MKKKYLIFGVLTFFALSLNTSAIGVTRQNTQLKEFARNQEVNVLLKMQGDPQILYGVGEGEATERVWDEELEAYLETDESIVRSEPLGPYTGMTPELSEYYKNSGGVESIVYYYGFDGSVYQRIKTRGSGQCLVRWKNEKEEPVFYNFY